jgi:hypothetical protein
MVRTALGIGLVALAVAAASWALPGPLVTRGSAALPAGCDPAAVAALAAGRAAGDGERVVYVAVLPNRDLPAHQGEFHAGLTGPKGTSVVHATVDCAKLALLTWDATPQQGAFTSAGPCPQPKGWLASGPTVACAGLPTAWETSDDFTVKSVAKNLGSCDTTHARARAISLLHALDYGNAAAFSAAFQPKGAFRPYTATLAAAISGRPAIAAFIQRRIVKADGWTATSLSAPLERSRTTTTYGVALVAFSNGHPVGAGSARMTLDCTSGLIHDWRGPALPLPV